MNLFDNQMKKFIRDFQVGQRVDNYFRVVVLDKRTKKDGGVFLTLELMDKTGRMPAKVWNNAESTFKILKVGEVYRMNGVVNEYQNKKELKVDGIRPVSPEDKDFNPRDFTEKAAFDTQALFKQLLELLKSNLADSHLIRLVDEFAATYGERFMNHYGAMKIHHAYLGGLLEHTYSMAGLALEIAKHYNLDRDVLLMGVLFHDSGKMFEFDVFPAAEATMEGGLLGHIMISHSLFVKLKDKVANFPRELACKIQHLIISHHGEKEYGSPEVPRTPEAMAMHIIDLLDSKLKIMEEAVKGSESQGLFTDYVHAMGRRMFIDKAGKYKN